MIIILLSSILKTISIELVDISKETVDSTRALRNNIKFNGNKIGKNKRLIVDKKQVNLAKSKNYFLTIFKNHD